MKRRTPIAVLGGLIATAGLVAAPLAPAGAEPARDIHQTTADAGERQQIRDYWTGDRMRSAQERSIRPDAQWRPAGVETGEPTKVPGTQQSGQQNQNDDGGSGQQPTAEPNIGGPWTGGGEVVDSTGKVFFTLGGSDYVCSASVVPAENDNTVATAGHCLNEGPGAYATNFLFVPGYDNGSAPHGEWPAEALVTTNEWKDSGDFNYDVGFAVIAPLDGQNLSDVVSTQTIGFNQPRGEFLHAFGYPAAAPYDGTELVYCSATATDDTRGSEDQRLDCNMTGGSSGGPWFADFDEAAGTGTQVSVNSFGYEGEENAMYGPYFGSTIESLYNAAEGYTPTPAA